jgi:hypothetical protein
LERKSFVVDAVCIWAGIHKEQAGFLGAKGWDEFLPVERYLSTSSFPPSTKMGFSS